MTVLESILKEDGSGGIPKREKALLEESVLKVYETAKGKTPRLSGFRAILASHDAVELRTYGEILYSWTGKTAYGNILDGGTTIGLDKRLVSFEMKGLDTHPDLQSVLMLILTDFIKREAVRDMATPYLLIIDEGWKLIESPGGLGFVAEAFRTFRKYNGGIWCISQNYRNFLVDEEVKNALFPNTASLFILGRARSTGRIFKKLFTSTMRKLP